MFPGLPVIKYKSVPDSAVIINNVLPGAYNKSGRRNIGYTFWETNRLPSHWVSEMNQMTEIWTTSRWAKDVFEDSGVKVPVQALSLGINKNLYFPKKRTRGEVFKFLSIGSPSTRKNSQMTVDAYLKVFGGRKDVHLVYKTIGSPDARFRPGTVHVKPIEQCENITVIDEDLSEEALADLYDSIDCVVYPTSGEGWGLFPYQSIAKGIPTICTSGTACSEYADWSIPLDFTWSSQHLFGIYEGCGEWMMPNFDDLCDKMLYAFENYDKCANFTFKNAKQNYSKMTWDFAIEGYYDRVCQILNQ